MPIPHDFPPGAGICAPLPGTPGCAGSWCLPTALFCGGASPQGGAGVCPLCWTGPSSPSGRAGRTSGGGCTPSSPIQALCQALGRGETTLKRWIRELEARELIFRTVPLPGGWHGPFSRCPNSPWRRRGRRSPTKSETPGRNPPGPPAPAACPKTTSTGCSRPSRRSYPLPQAESGPGPDLADPRPNLAGGGAESGPYSSNLTK